MAPTLVQAKIGGVNGTAAATYSLSFNTTVTSGNSVIVIAADAAASGTALQTIRDDKNNSYTILRRVNEPTDQATLSIAYLSNITNGPLTVTGSWSPTEAFTKLQIEEWSGIGLVDGTVGGAINSSTGTAANGISCGTLTPTVAGDLIWAATLNTTDSTSGGTAGTGFTQDLSGSAGNFQITSSEYLVQGTAASITPTFTNKGAASIDWVSVSVAIKATTGAVAANIGKIAPYLFRPNAGPQRGFNPNFAYPTYPAPAPGAVSLFGLSAVQTRMPSQATSSTSLFGNVKGPLVKSAPSIMASVTTLLSRSTVTSTLHAASLMTANMQALITRGVAQVQARLAQPTGQTSLFGRAKGPAIQGRAAPSVTAQVTALTGLVKSLFQAKSNLSATYTPVLVQHIGSDLNDQNMGPPSAGNNFVFYPPNPVLAGNCLILYISYPFGNTVSIGDTNGTWSGTASATITDSSNLVSSIYVLPNATAGTHKMTVSFNGTAGSGTGVVFPFQYSLSEFNNIALTSPADGSHGIANAVGPHIVSGTFTPTTNNDVNGGHLIVSYAIENSTVGTIAGDMANSIVANAGQTLLDADNICTIPHCTSYLIQTTNAAISPGFAINQGSPSNNNFNCLSLALKTANAGTAPSSVNVRVVRLLHTSPYQDLVQGSTTNFQFPSSGNLLVWSTASPTNILTYGSITSVSGGTFTEVNITQGNPQVFYLTNAQTSGTLSVSVNVTTNPGGIHTSARLFDIANAGAFDKSTGTNGTSPGSSPFNDWPDFQPTSAPGITIATFGLGTGPVNDLASGAPAGAVYDVVNYTSMNDGDEMDNADGVAHFYHQNTNVQHWNWNLYSSALNQTAYVTALSFKQATQTTIIALIAKAVSSVIARFLQPTGTTRLVGRTAAMVVAQESPTITRSLSARGDISTFSRAVSSVKTVLAALANASPAKARLAQAIGASSLFARATSQVTVRFTQSTGTVKLLARSVVQSKIVATLISSNVIQLLARSMLAMQGEASIAVTTVLHAATAITVKSAQTLTAQAALTRALIGTTSAKITARLAPLSTAFLTTHINVQIKTPNRPTAIAPLSVVTKIMTTIVEGSGFSSGFSSGFGSLFILTTNLFSRAVTQVKALPVITAQSQLSRALAGATKAMITARLTSLSGSLALQARIAIQAKATETLTLSRALAGAAKSMIAVRLAQASGSLALTGAAKSIITGRLAQASGSLALQARTAIQAKVAETLMVVSPLARALTNATKAMVTARLAQASGALALQARTAVQVKVAETLTAAAPLTSALTGVGKAVVTATGSLVGFKFLSSRTAAQTRARAATTVQTALAAAATIAAQARLTQPLAKVALAARTALQTQAQPHLVAAQAIFGRAAIQARSRLNSASRTIYLGAQATVTVTGRLAQPTGKVLLSGFTALAVKVKPRMQAVGNMLALSPGLATTMFRAGLSSATFRSIATRAVTSLGSFYTAITSITSTFASTIFGEPAVTTSIAGNLAASSGGMAVVAISQLGGPVMATGPTVTGQISIALGTTVQFSTVFNANPPGAVVNISYFQNDTLTTGSGPIPMVFQSGTTWTAQWDSGVSDGGRVDWSMHTTGGEPVLVQNGYFFLASNDATVIGL